MKQLDFNIAGPCIQGQHYMIDPLRGMGDDIMALIEGNKYFVIHAARQSGKSTMILDIVDRINTEGRYYAVYCSLEVVDQNGDADKVIPIVIECLQIAIRDYELPDGFGINVEDNTPDNMLRTSIASYCKALDKPLVIFFDEADVLSNGALISFLRQLRNGYITRGKVPFAQSISLTGMRNLRDYKVMIRPDSESTGTTSPFNIITESFNLRNFTKEEVAELYEQHTAATGQAFSVQMIDYVFEQTQGQPWLVNAIARECVEKILKKDHTTEVTKPHAEQAILNIVKDRRTHIDSLMNRLKDPRVRSVMLQLLTGGTIYDRDTDDYLYTRDLGLIREEDGDVIPANPIYGEMIIRTLSRIAQDEIEREHKDYTIPRYLKNGELDLNFLIGDFQKYWRENSEIWKERYRKSYYEYDEAAPQLVMLAFLQRVINGGGKVIRELATGTKRVDICVAYNGRNYPIELKILQNEKSRSDSHKQLLEYMDKTGSDTGWLVIFDRNARKRWDRKIYLKEDTIKGKRIITAGC